MGDYVRFTMQFKSTLKRLRSGRPSADDATGSAQSLRYASRRRALDRSLAEAG
jgi:hypothetical protein